MTKREYFKLLPAIDELLSERPIVELINKYPEQTVKKAAVDAVDFYRKKILALEDKESIDFTSDDLIAEVEGRVIKYNSYSLVPTINGTGTVGHTNLGRAILSKEALDHVIQVSGSYNNLEYNLDQGHRGSRYDHVRDLLLRLTSAEDCLIVNNNAAAVFLILNTLAQGGETIVSRGELVEIGGSFRISSIMEASGSKLIEVGATNKVHLKDYQEKINDQTKCIMKVHTSNFSVVGFHEEVSAGQLKELTQGLDIPIVEDLGSGTFIDFEKYGLSHERTVQESLAEGIDILSFSGDKILGGPQAGIILGKKKYIEQMKNNQLLRAFRVDKMTLAALEGTLLNYYSEEKAISNIPMLQLMTLSSEEILKKALSLKESILAKTKQVSIEIIDGVSQVGGGAYPTEELPSKVLALKTEKMTAQQLERSLRKSPAHIIGMIHNERYLLDCRCLFEEDFELIAETIKTVLE